MRNEVNATVHHVGTAVRSYKQQRTITSNNRKHNTSKTLLHPTYTQHYNRVQSFHAYQNHVRSIVVMLPYGVFDGIKQALLRNSGAQQLGYCTQHISIFKQTLMRV